MNAGIYNLLRQIHPAIAEYTKFIKPNQVDPFVRILFKEMDDNSVRNAEIREYLRNINSGNTFISDEHPYKAIAEKLDEKYLRLEHDEEPPCVWEIPYNESRIAFAVAATATGPNEENVGGILIDLCAAHDPSEIYLDRVAEALGMKYDPFDPLGHMFENNRHLCG